MTYIVSQIAGFSAFVISLIAYHKNSKKKIFQTMIVANVLDILHYLFLGAFSGSVTKIIALIRNEIIILKDKNKKLNNIYILMIFILAYIATGILTYKNIYSLLPIIAASIYLVFVWNGDEYKT